MGNSSFLVIGSPSATTVYLVDLTGRNRSLCVTVDDDDRFGVGVRFSTDETELVIAGNRVYSFKLSYLLSLAGPQCLTKVWPIFSLGCCSLTKFPELSPAVILPESLCFRRGRLVLHLWRPGHPSQCGGLVNQYLAVANNQQQRP